MDSPQVGQLQMLNRLLERVLLEKQPGSAAVLGCATGNGFEHFNPAVTKRILGLDINPAYLQLARERYAQGDLSLEFVCADIQSDWSGGCLFDLIHAALVFEYVQVEKTLTVIYRALKPAGMLSVVLQMPAPQLPAVSKTRFTSLEKLAPILHLHEQGEFVELARNAGFRETHAERISMPGGKQFYFGYFKV
jgi:ubiquinone/menaquinone biosynthesis C-methylase UbiE